MIGLNYSILNKRNEEGLIYACDLRRLLGYKMKSQELFDIQEKVSTYSKKQLAFWLWKVQFPDKARAFLKNLSKLRVKFYLKSEEK